jgi:hypothetical protein
LQNQVATSILNVTGRRGYEGAPDTGGQSAMNDQRNLLLVLELEPEAGSDDAERLGRQLRSDLSQLDVEAVKPAVVTDVPEGAKGGAVDWGSLLVTLSASGGVFASVIAMAKGWLAQHGAAQRIRITIDNDTIVLDRASAQERDELIGAWVRKHSVSSA